MAIGPTQIQEVRGELLKKTSTSLSDETASTILTVWGETTLKKGKAYTFKDVSVRSIGGMKVLSSTPSTEFSATEGIPEEKLCIPVQLWNQTSVTGKIISICVKQNWNCPSCNKSVSVPSTEDKFVRCQHCAMKMKSEKLHSSLIATLSIECADEVVKLSVFSSVLSTFLLTQDQADLIRDGQLVEDFFFYVSIKI